jgi:hypothetical protein
MSNPPWTNFSGMERIDATTTGGSPACSKHRLRQREERERLPRRLRH